MMGLTGPEPQVNKMDAVIEPEPITTIPVQNTAQNPATGQGQDTDPYQSDRELSTCGRNVY